MSFKELVNRLTPLYEEHEARSIIRILLQDAYSISFFDACLGALNNLSTEQQERLNDDISRIEKGEPVQYVIGKVNFCELSYVVRPGVLIPRPETEELVNYTFHSVLNRFEKNSVDISGDQRKNALHILDIGTGSGCIAITLALQLRDAEITAWDISEDALTIARENATRLSAKVRFDKHDALHAPTNDKDKWDVIVSNPPYICKKEMAEMSQNVLENEPHLALFVPDENPLLFYRAIAEYGRHALRDGGMIFFEINESYGAEMVELLECLGYKDVTLKQDQFGKDRVIMAAIER